MTQDKHRETARLAAEQIVGKQSQPVCPQCQRRMSHAGGFQNVPPHWYCQRDGVYADDTENTAAQSEQDLIERITTALTNLEAVTAPESQSNVRESPPRLVPD